MFDCCNYKFHNVHLCAKSCHSQRSPGKCVPGSKARRTSTSHPPLPVSAAQKTCSIQTLHHSVVQDFPRWLVPLTVPAHSLTAHLPPPNSPQCKGAPADDGLEQGSPTTTGSRFLPARHIHHQHTQTLPLADLKLRLSKHHCSKHITGFQSWKPHCAIVWSWLVYVKR